MPPSEWETALDLELAWVIWEMWQNVTFNVTTAYLHLHLHFHI